MAAPNLVIIQLLHTQSNQSEFLRLCWDKLSVDQKKEVYHFLYLSGLYKTFLSILRVEINSESPVIPWSHLLSILHQRKKLNAENIKSFISSGSSREQLGLFRIDHPELAELWQQKKKDIITQFENKKTELLKELEKAKQSGFRDQRSKILNDLRNMFPADLDVIPVLQTEKEYNARQTLSKIFSKRLSYTEWDHAPRENMEKNDLKSMFKTIKKTIKKNPTLALDFAILFYQMELYTPSLAVIDLIKNKSFNELWHELQISIEGKQFARALSVIGQLKHGKLTNDHSFSLLYFQALALYGLGEKTEAKQIIRNIIRIRPNFRSATSLLLEWESDK